MMAPMSQGDVFTAQTTTGPADKDWFEPEQPPGGYQSRRGQERFLPDMAASPNFATKERP